MSRFERLEVWKRATQLCTEIYQYFAKSSDYGFRDQITRSALFIPSNIAEGYERNSDKEMANFLNYAKGSAGELRTQIYMGMAIEYVAKEHGERWISESEEISRMLFGLRQSILNRDT